MPGSRSRMRASSPMAERGATELEQLVAVENLGCRGRLFVIVLFDRMVLEGEAFVEFDERNREDDLGRARVSPSLRTRTFHPSAARI